MKRSLAWLVALSVFAVACSSAPPAPEGVQDRKNRAADYLKFGRQAFREAQYEQALSFYLIAVDLNTAVDYELGMAAAWNSVATAQAALGRTTETLAALEQAEAFAGSAGDSAVRLQVAVNRVQSDLEAGNLEGARTRLEALRPFAATAEGAALDHAWGMLAKQEGQTEEALAAFDRSLALNTKLSLRQEMASNHFMKASVNAKLQRWDEARKDLLAALALDKMMENTMGIGQDLRALGTVAQKQERPQEALDAYLRAYRLFQAAGLPDQQKRTRELLVPVATALGRLDLIPSSAP